MRRRFPLLALLVGAALLSSSALVAQGELYLSIPQDEYRTSTSASPFVDRLLDLMQERLSLMHEVARWKWNYGRAVEDLEQEARLLAALVPQASAYGVDRELAERFIQAQMDAAKAIQLADMAKFAADGSSYFEGVEDLVESIRPRLASLTREILASLAQLDLEDSATSTRLGLRIEEISSAQDFEPCVYDLAFGPLLVH